MLAKRKVDLRGIALDFLTIGEFTAEFVFNLKFKTKKCPCLESIF
jgi:hypothetical protein